MFPIIEHIDDILPYVEHRDDFIIVDKGDYKYVDYVFTEPDSFDNPFRLECRGIKFLSDGRLLSRPLHKFFNLGEKDFDFVDLGKPHRVYDKLDGTMVHGAILNNELCLMTRRGITDHAMAAYKLLTDEQKDYLFMVCKSGFTPILEYIGPENQIVVYYEKPELVWLTWRDNTKGRYPRYDPVDLQMYFNTPKQVPKLDVDKLRNEKNIEGVVVVWNDGNRIKIKTDEYVQKHRIATGPSLEIHYLDSILENTIDDIIALKSGEFKERLEQFRDDVYRAMLFLTVDVRKIVAENKDVSQKQFAVETLNRVEPQLRSAYFQWRSGKFESSFEVVRSVLKKIFKSQKQLNENRHLIGGAKLEL